MPGSRVRIEWHDREVKRDTRRKAGRAVAKAAEMYRSALVEELRANSTRVAGPSAPHEIPHVDTGKLSQSIFVDVEETSTGAIAKVGSPLEYALHLERGTRKMQPRPFFVPVLIKMRHAFRRIMPFRFRLY